MVKFLEFCNRLALNTDFSGISDVTLVPERYQKATNTMVNMMKNKAEIFDVINVPFVEMVFDNGDYENILDSKLIDGEVPDGIIHVLSRGIFKESPVNLTKNQSAIIKVLSVYICIQN